MDRHGGEIEVRAAVGQGTTFDIYLPVQPSRCAQAPFAEVPAPAIRLHVLVMDEEEPILCVAQQTLSSAAAKS